MSEVIVVTSGKGGVGKTTTAANIGTGLAALDKKVVLVDTDIGLRNLDVVLGLENRIVYNLVDVIEGNCRLKQVLIKDKRYANLFLLPSAQTRDKTSVTPEQMKKLCEELKKQFDYILLDCPAGIEQGFRNAIAGASKALVVTTPEVSAIRDADRIIGLLEAEDLRDIHLIINRLRMDMVKRGDMMSVEDVSDILAVPLIGILPDDEQVVIATVVYSASLICNVLVNALLIFGLFGLPKMGIMGAAIGTLTARIVELIIVIWYARVKNHDVRFHPVYMRKIDKLLLKDFLIYASPVILNELMWGLGSTANTAVIGHLGSAAVAANSVAQVARQLATVVAFGVSNATAIYLGKTIGAKEFHLAKEYGKRFLWLSIITGAVGGGIILIAAPIANHVMTLSQEAQGYLSFMFFVMSYFTLCQAINTTLVVGVFRAGGDTRFGLILDVSTMWGCSILLGMIAAFVFHAPVQVVYILLMSDEVIKVPITVMRYRSYKWIQNVTREKAELA